MKTYKFALVALKSDPVVYMTESATFSPDLLMGKRFHSVEEASSHIRGMGNDPWAGKLSVFEVTVTLEKIR